MQSKEFTNQLDCIKTWARSIIELIDKTELNGTKDCADLLNSIEDETNSMNIHVESARDIMSNWIN